MADKVKEVATEEAERIKALTVEAARSAAYLYPLRVRYWIPIAEQLLMNRRGNRALHISYPTATYGVL